MPISYTFDHKNGLILTRVSGLLNLSITWDYFERLQQDEDCPANAIEIVDFTEVTDFAINYGDMSNITEAYQGAKSTRAIRATVFNCTNNLSFGIARMLQTLHELTNPSHEVIITRSQTELKNCIESLRSGESNPAKSR